MMYSIKYFNKFILYFFPIVSTFFYRYIGFNNTVCKGVYFVFYIFLFIYICRDVWFRKKRPEGYYKSNCNQIIIILLVSSTMSFIFWQQSFLLSYRGAVGLWGHIIFYFFLLKAKFSIEDIEKFIKVQLIIYTCAYVFALYSAPLPIYSGGIDGLELDDSRGVFRIFTPNRGFLLLGYVYFLNKWITSRLKFDGFITIGAFVLIVMLVERQIILIFTLITLYCIFRRLKYIGIIIVISFFVIQDINVQFDSDSVVGSLLELSENQISRQKLGDKDIRLQEYEYYFTKYSRNMFTVLFGNGQPHPESNLGLYEDRLHNMYKYYQSDVGYGQIFIVFGIVGLLVFMNLLFKVFRQKLDDRFYYAKMFMVYIAFGSIASSPFMSMLTVISVVLYVMDKSYFLNKTKKNKHSCL